MAKVKRKCPCYDGWVCEEHPNQPWVIRAVKLQVNFVQIQRVTKTPILFFYPSIVRYSLEEESRRLEKPSCQRRD